MADRAFLSIGDVLALLKDEFPDVTISKIRFLESQGLLDPERTPSGYRKFYESDVDRLRWILRQQREHFLPLKVIKGRLSGGAPLEAELPSSSFENVGEGEAPGANGSQVTAQLSPGAPGSAPPVGPAPPAGPIAPPGSAGPAGPTAPGGPAGSEPFAPSAPAPLASGGPSPGSTPSPLSAGPAAMSLTADELTRASGLSADGVAELERYGLLSGRAVGGTFYYDEEAFTVATAAAGFAAHGIEPRHLRMYKTAAEREGDLYEQVVMPLLKQRNPEARGRAASDLAELARLGQRLRASLLRVALREHTGG